MTTLVLTQRRILTSLRIRDLHLAAGDYFARLNRRGLLTIFSAAVIILGVAVYVSMLIMTFDSGLRLQGSSLENNRQSEELKRLEVLERRREAEFAVRHRDILEKMDKISVVKYLVPEGPTVSQAVR